MDDAGTEPLPDPEDRGLPGRKVLVRSSRKEEVLELSLVLASQGIKHWMEFDGREFVLTLEDASLPVAEGLLEVYRSENESFRDEAAPSGKLDLYLSPLVQLAIPVIAYFWVGLKPWSAWLKGRGLADSGLILEGEWWRCLTATTLHADHEHFLGNVLSGFFILNLLNHRLGMGTIAALSTAGAFAANWLVAFVEGPGHRSLGYSSVVFCALGLLGAVETVYLRRRKEWSLRRMSPLIAAFFIAVMVGLGENSDVKAHFYGFGLGAALGFASRWLPRSLARAPFQAALILLTYGAYILAWSIAMK